MSGYKGSMPERLCEFLKLMRSQRLSVEQMAKMLGWSHDATRQWAVEFSANGLLVHAGRARVGKRGKLSQVYTLSPQWGGTLTVDEQQVVLIERVMAEDAQR